MHVGRSPWSYWLFPIAAVLVAGGCNCHEPRVLIDTVEGDPEGFNSPLIDHDASIACIDADGDGFGDGPDCLGRDCDDTDPNLGSSGTRSCYSGPSGTEGVGACRAGTQTCTDGVFTQCQNEVGPSAEVCDNVDNDCNGQVDEQLTRSCYSGPEGTLAVGVCTAGVQTCVAGAFGACQGEVTPSAEVCDNQDNNCDGRVDEAVVRSCYNGPAGTSGVGACVAGIEICSAGTFGACQGEVVPASEVCDNVDNDCDGQVDEAVTRTCYSGPAGTAGVGMCQAGVQLCSAGQFGSCQGEVGPSNEVCDNVDNDCDGTVDENVVRSCYTGPAGTQGVGTCQGGTQTCSAGQFGACLGEVGPAGEICDNLDNDCDGAVDENITRTCYSGPAGTEGVGVCQGGTQTCSAGSFGQCVGEVTPVAEICDNVDNDCDGAADENITRTCYSGPAGTQGVGLCQGGTQTCTAGAFGQCSGEVTPATELCDGFDNDCDGSTDENITRACYTGQVGTEGVGMCQGGTQTCAAGTFGQCEGQVTPSAEICDNLDNDCDGTTDENIVRVCYSGPAGTESVGACQTGTQTCSAGAFGQCVGEVTPIPETCDNQDNDCDGTTDENITRACYTGPTFTEGVGICSGGSQTCVAGLFTACEGETTPGVETCDAQDNDCDGQVDENIQRACYSGPAGTQNVGTCRGGTQVCVAGAFGACANEVLPATEVCDNQDNDCDGTRDENLVRACYSGPDGTSGVGVCAGGLQTCVAGSYGACENEVVPNPEVCDGWDNDCDGQVDQSVSRSCYSGPAGTQGVGACRAGTQTCSSGGYGLCENEVLPSYETCDGIDNNCNGQTDENITRVSRDGSQQQVETRYRPVDIIFVVDNSCSMTEEIVSIENNINNSFASIMDASGLDYRVIMLSKHGSATSQQSICVRPPLSGNTSCSNSCPVNTSRFFQYSVEIGSHDSLDRIISTYNTPDPCGKAPGGWSDWLRADSLKVFIEITDDGPTWREMNATTFETNLLALSPARFGTATQRDYIFHTIAGLKENSPRLSPWLPSSPLVTALCTGNGGNVEQNGVEYQKLSQWSGGLRYPICEYQSFDAVFQQVAQGIVASAQMACDFQITTIPADSGMENTVVEFVPSAGGAVVPMPHVADASACTGHGFYTVGNQVSLCPMSCTAWRDDPDARVDVLFTCFPQVP